MTDTVLLPGFMAVHSNHPEALRDLMLAWMARHPLAPLEDEWVLVQSNGVAQWLRLSLARDPAQGGVGIAAAQLTERLADLFDQYQVYRADWLAAWAAGQDLIVASRSGAQPVPDELRWQPRLWRALLDDVGPAGAAHGRAAVHQRFMAAASGWQGERPAGLPRRLVVFGVSSLPQQSLEVLGALARWMQVLMCVHNPCEHDWSHIVADKDLLRAERLRQRRRPGGEGAIADENLHLHAQPLLAAWGKQGRDFIRLLDDHDAQETYAQHFDAIGQRIDCFDANPKDTLLRQLQDD